MRLTARMLSGVLLALCPVAQRLWAQPVPLGTQFQVNSYTTGTQNLANVAADGAGNFVVVWKSYGSVGSDDSGAGIQGQRYDAAGTPVGSQFQVNSYTTSAQLYPAVAATESGEFVVVWQSYGSVGSDDDGASIQGQRYDASGAPAGSQFQVNTYTTDTQYRPDVAADDSGNFVVVWSGFGFGTDPYEGIQGQRYDAAGALVGSEFQVNSYTTDDQLVPAVAADPAGNFVVVWMSYGSSGLDTDGHSIQGQRYDATGTPVGSEFQVNSYTTDFQTFPAVAADASGNFVVTWEGFGSGSDTDSYSVHAQRYDAAGAALGSEFQVNSYTTGFQDNPRVAADDSGNFVVVWESGGSSGSDTSANSIHGQRYNAAGAAVGSEFQVNSYTTNHQGTAAVTANPAGNFTVAWVSNGSSGSDTGSYSVQAQRYAIGRTILGKKILVKDPTGLEINRAVVALGKESATDIGPSIVGDPTVSGATLRVITNGTTDSDQTYVLDAGGWAAAGTAGFKYTGPTPADNDPVKKVIVKRTPAGRALVKALVKGNVGLQSLDVVPPNLGDSGGMILTINGGATYCSAFGAGAGGSETADSPTLWKIINATAEACPSP